MSKLISLLTIFWILATAGVAEASIWTTANEDACTITITPSGRTTFRVTVGGIVTLYDLSDHEPITLDVDGATWSVEVERSSGWYTDAQGEATECTPTPTTEPPPATTIPPTTTTIPVTTTTIRKACDKIECYQPSTTTRQPPTSTEAPPSTTSSDEPSTPPNNTESPPATTSGQPGSIETLPATGSSLIYLSLFGIAMVGLGYALLRKPKR